MTSLKHSTALILIRGLPGSGKSFLAEKLQQTIGSDQVVILDPDKIDKSSQEYITLCNELAAEGIEEKFFPNRFLKSVGFNAMESGKIVIWNQAFTDLGGFNRTIAPLQEFAQSKSIDLPVLVVEVTISHDVAKKRVADRVSAGGHDVNEEAFARFIEAYQTFAGQGFNIVEVNGDDNVDDSAEAVLKALAKLQK